MSKKVVKSRRSPLFERVREILESAQSSLARTVNSTQVLANWSIGREIVEEEQRGERRAGYGQALLKELSVALQARFGRGYSVDNLEAFRKFFLTYPTLVESAATTGSKISETPSRKLVAPKISETPSRKLAAPAGRDSSAQGRVGTNWKPGQLHPGLSWSHYRALLKVERPEARAFYEIEAAGNNWAVREMERQIGSLLYERLALSKDKKGLLKLAKKGQEIQIPTDVFKDPMVIEFVGLPEAPKLVETDLEEGLISNLHAFLLELGRGFAFIKRQQRITLDGDHFYIDLVFYHTILKCYILIDLKTEKLTHQDLGQLQLYVNYYDCECLSEGDNPTLGLILCTDKNDALVKYTLGPNQKKQIFASKYKLHLPTEAELKAELNRELRALSRGTNKGGPK